jgi:light-regulated signal transduction histidine kinase (bacteriophytochrome)
VDGVPHGHVWVFRDVTAEARGRRAAQPDHEGFIAVVSHELRTPLTSIATFTELLTADAHPRPDEVPGALAAIARNTERMLTLLEDLSLLGRLESDTAGPGARAVVDLVPLLDAAAALLQALTPGLAAHVYVEPGPAVRGDPRLLRELLLTMAGATAACAAGGEAYVSARADGTEWTVSMGVTEARDVTNELLLGTRLPAADPAAPPRSVALAMLLARAIAVNQGGALTTSSGAPDTLTLVLRLPVPT